MLNSIGRTGLLDVSQPSRSHGRTELITKIVNPLSNCSTSVHPNVTRSTRTFEHNANNHNNSNFVNNYKKHNNHNNHITIIPARRATPCRDTEVQVRQAAQPSERRRQGRRDSGTAGRLAERGTPPGPSHCRGRGCCACGGEGRWLS